jgi:hypothetical protein
MNSVKRQYIYYLVHTTNTWARYICLANNLNSTSYHYYHNLLTTPSFRFEKSLWIFQLIFLVLLKF